MIQRSSNLGFLRSRYWTPSTFPVGTQLSVPLLEFELVLMRADRLSLLFGYLFHIAAFLGAIFALHVRDTMQQVSVMVYAGSALGAVFAGDLITLFIFWELLAISSVFLIWARGTERALKAGMRYLVRWAFSLRNR